MNCTIAKSALVLNGKLVHDYEGPAEKIILLDLKLSGKVSVCTYYEEKSFLEAATDSVNVLPRLDFYSKT